MQVFANPECTQYATGEVDTVYVRVNTPWSGVDSGWVVGNPDEPGAAFGAISPSTYGPDDPYSFQLWVDFMSQTDGPYTAGQVVEAKFAGEPMDVTDFTKVFSKP